ncbi:MAG: hypothetical protein B6229_04385 [Spirochaetaceae bacterium 4572_7]|nr:MAG: hypothetical protein B6229_04385 [Spirochaetaceae bacterium 4572_7]
MNNMSYFFVSLNVISISAIIMIITVTSRKLKKHGGKELLLIFVFIFIASMSSFIESIYTGFEVKHLWRNISQLGYFMIPSASFNFIMRYTKVNNKFVDKLIYILFIYASICILLIFTNGFHHIMRESVTLNSNGVLKIGQTLFGKITVALNTLISFSGIVRLWIFLMKSTRSSRNQIIYIFVGFLIPIVLTYTRSILSGFIGFTFPTSTSFLLGIIFIIIGMYQYEFLSTSPIAMSWVLDEIDLGILYTNTNGLAVDKNRCLNDLSWDIEQVISKNIRWESAIKKLYDDEIEIFEDNKYFYIKIHHLKVGGAISLIRDITADKFKENELKLHAETDRMTKILNRESFILKTQKLLDEHVGDSSLIIIDIDYFKTINDTYGHMAGDYVIKTIVNLLKNNLRDGDLVGRLGGDEFIIYVDRCHIDQIEGLTSRIKESVRNFLFEYDTKLFKTSLSIGGVVNNNKIFKELYKIADEALYEAKESGRNRVIIR